MLLAVVARDPFFFWDVRVDNLWLHALIPLETPLEHAGNRAAYVHYLKHRFRERYERIFIPLPDLSAVLQNVGPFGIPGEQDA